MSGFYVIAFDFLWENGRWLSCHYHCEWRGVVKLDSRNTVHDVVHLDRWKTELRGGRVHFGMKLSEDWEPLLLVLMKCLIKQAGFMVLESAGAEVFTGKKQIARARDADHGVSSAARGRQGVFFQ